MTAPCRSNCPAGDCAGCAFPPKLTLCNPSRPCPQANHCVRCTERRIDGSIDGTVLHVGNFCPLFLDIRHPALEFA